MVLTASILVGSVAAPDVALAQDAATLQHYLQSLPPGVIDSLPLVLKGEGSFFVGGDRVSETGTELGAAAGCSTCSTDGHVTNNQMYVKYMQPLFGNGVPIVLIEGGGLSTKQYETTPDGRIGWYEYFVRKGHPVYLPDQPTRGLSGFDQAIFNDVGAGVSPPSAQPAFSRTSDELAWTAFRWGPSYGVKFPDEQYPVEAAGEFSKQGIASLYGLLPTPNPMYAELSQLAVKVQGAVLVGHSQSGAFPFQTALTSQAGIKGMILIESGCGGLTNQQVKTLAATSPILIVFGDHLDAGTPYPFKALFQGCQAFIDQVNSLGGNAKMLHPPALGIFGNSHMIMQDRNNLQIADLILRWMDHNVR